MLREFLEKYGRGSQETFKTYLDKSEAERLLGGRKFIAYFDNAFVNSTEKRDELFNLLIDNEEFNSHPRVVVIDYELDFGVNYKMAFLLREGEEPWIG